jgi:hypothetical protein
LHGAHVNQTLGSRRWTWQLEGKPPSIWARWRHRAVAPRVSPTLQMHYIPPWLARWQPFCVGTKPKPNSFYMNAREVLRP